MAASPGVHLRRTDENVREIEALAAVLGGTVGLEGVVEDLRYRLHRARVLPRLVGRAVREAWAFDRYDQADRTWYPQGISTSADASDEEVVHGRRMLMTTWYSTGADGIKRGSRITVVDLESGRYRHVLLVVPVLDAEGRLTLRPMDIHAGGIVWVGPYVHVAATGRGFVTARVDDIMRVVGDDERPDELGVLDGDRVASFGHRYVLPVRFTYAALADEGHERLRYSFMSLDRESTPPTLLAGEYALRPGTTTRLARYRLDPATDLLEVGEDGHSRPFELTDEGVRRMQGVAVARSRLHLTVSNGPWGPGTVFSGPPGALRMHRWALPMGPEDLSYWPSTDRLWSVTEHPWRRWVVAMDRAWFDR